MPEFCAGPVVGHSQRSWIKISIFFVSTRLVSCLFTERARFGRRRRGMARQMPLRALPPPKRTPCIIGGSRPDSFALSSDDDDEQQQQQQQPSEREQAPLRRLVRTSQLTAGPPPLRGTRETGKRSAGSHRIVSSSESECAVEPVAAAALGADAMEDIASDGAAAEALSGSPSASRALPPPPPPPADDHAVDAAEDAAEKSARSLLRRELLLLEQDVWAQRVAQDWPQFRPLWRHRVAQATSAGGLGSLLSYFEAHCPPASAGKAPGWRAARLRWSVELERAHDSASRRRPPWPAAWGSEGPALGLGLLYRGRRVAASLGWQPGAARCEMRRALRPTSTGHAQEACAHTHTGPMPPRCTSCSDS